MKLVTKTSCPCLCPGELCEPLNCKKKEICLLEDAYTAVCVSTKELRRNGDKVVTKDRLPPEEAARFSAVRDQDPFYDSDDEDDEDEQSQDVVAA